MTCCQKWKTDPTWVYFGSGSADFRNPVQGAKWGDCTFLAALTSMVWTNPPSFVAQDAQKTLTYNFYNGGTTTPASINNNLLVVDPGATPLCFCGVKSNLFDTKKEIWPALYEKAYAKYCFYKKGLINLGDLNDATKWPLDASGNPVSPCILTFTEWGGNPVTVLGILTGCPTQVQTIYPKDGSGMPVRTSPYDLNCSNPVYTYKDSNYPDGSYIWQFIKNCFCNIPGWVAKTKKPMVAWTYQDNSYLPAGKSFSPTGIQANHSYAILGTFSSGGKYFVVLRDPCGMDPTSTAISKASGTYQYLNGTADFCTKGIGSLIETPGNRTLLSFADQDGVFGLEAYELKTYFEGFGWIP